jgi:Protein kinase domain
VTPIPPSIGDELADYRLDEILGRGAISVVYRAERPDLGDAVALKVLAHELATDDLFRLRFLHLARVAASINHPNVVPIFDWGAWGDLLFIAMRFVAGADLGTVLGEQGRLDPAQALTVVGQAARAVDAAHGQGLVHRDFKPTNVLIERGADVDHVYVADFGIIPRALSRTELNASGEFVGTVDYIAPEQVRGERVDAPADIYSLGCVLYHCLTGRAPFQNEEAAAVLRAHLELEPTAPSAVRPELSPGIDDVIARALAKAPEDRYATGRELMAAMRAALGSDSTTRGAVDAGDRPADTVLVGHGASAVGAPSTPGEPPTGTQLPAGSMGRATRDRPPLSETKPPRLGALGAGTELTSVGPPPPRPSAASRRGPPPVPPTRSGGGFGGRGLIAAGVAVAVVVALLIVVLGGGGSPHNGTTHAAASSGGMSHSTTSKSSSSIKKKMPVSNPILQTLQVTNESRTAKHLLPPASCTAQGASAVICTRPAFGATAVRFQTYQSLDELYHAYVAAIKRVAPGAFHANFGDCTEGQTDGEVSWNHNYQHPRHFSLEQSRSGHLTDDQAAGRVFCTFTNSLLFIVWTQNDGRLLGVLSGAPHANTWDWWKGVHHSIDLPGSPSGMSMP